MSHNPLSESNQKAAVFHLIHLYSEFKKNYWNINISGIPVVKILNYFQALEFLMLNNEVRAHSLYIKKKMWLKIFYFPKWPAFFYTKLSLISS